VFWIGEGEITFRPNFRFKIIYNREPREFDHLYVLGKARFASYLNFLLSYPFLGLHFLFFPRHWNIFVFLESVRKMDNYIPAFLTLDPLPARKEKTGSARLRRSTLNSS
jgi:hypothetical protein